jgi:chromate transport protein ChrA
VVRRKWIDEEAYADLVALCQFLPGPASSQVGLALGWKRAGWAGALAAWVAFTAPSALLMVAFAYGVRIVGDLSHAGWVQGLKVAAVAVVAQAVWTMARKLCPDAPRATIAVASAIVLAIFTTSWMQLVVIAGGAIAGGLLGRSFSIEKTGTPPPPHHHRAIYGYVCLGLFFGLLVALPWLVRILLVAFAVLLVRRRMKRATRVWMIAVFTLSVAIIVAPAIVTAGRSSGSHLTRMHAYVSTDILGFTAVLLVALSILPALIWSVVLLVQKRREESLGVFVGFLMALCAFWTYTIYLI